MGAFSGLYGDTPSFSFTSPPAVEGTGQPVPSSLPSWAQTGLSLFGGVTGQAVNLLNAVNQFRSGSSSGSGRLGDDYETDKEAREREGYNVPRSASIPTWLVAGVGLLVVGIIIYKAAE